MRLPGTAVCTLAAAIFGVFSAVATGCAPVIGDSCNDSVDCSVNGDRVCDNTQPNGYCTIQSCEADTCPDEAVCVRFRPEPSRLAQAWCMSLCEYDDWCRQEEGYACVTDEQLGTFEVEPGFLLPVAQTLDVEMPNRTYCAAVASGL